MKKILNWNKYVLKEASMQNNTKYIISVTAKKVLKELEDKKNK